MDQRYLRFPQEIGFGDGHYNTGHNFLIPPRKPNGGYFTDEQLEVYSLMQLARSPVEPIMGCFKLHGCFKTKWARSPEALAMWYKVLTHLRIRNMYIKADAGCPRHRGCGPYRHW